LPFKDRKRTRPKTDGLTTKETHDVIEFYDCLSKIGNGQAHGGNDGRGNHCVDGQAFDDYDGQAIMAMYIDIDGKSSLQKPQGFEVPTEKPRWNGSSIRPRKVRPAMAIELSLTVISAWLPTDPRDRPSMAIDDIFGAVAVECRLVEGHNHDIEPTSSTTRK
jgi:hypothetical protein